MGRSLVLIETPHKEDRSDSYTGSLASNGRGTMITLGSGVQIPEVKSVDIHISPTEVITAKIHLNAAFKGNALATFFVKDPRTGEDKEVSSIVWEDGSTWNPAG